MRSNDVIQIREDVWLDIGGAVLEHLHADDRIEARLVLRLAQRFGRGEPHPWQFAEPGVAVAQLFDVDVRRERLAEEIVHQCDEGSIAAPVVEQRAAGSRRRELPGEREAPPMAPRNDAIAAEDLFTGVMACFEQFLGWRRHG